MTFLWWFATETLNNESVKIQEQRKEIRVEVTSVI